MQRSPIRGEDAIRGEGAANAAGEGTGDASNDAAYDNDGGAAPMTVIPA